MEVAFNVATAAVVVVSVRVVGVLLIAAAIVVPAASALLLARSFGPLLIASALLGAATAVVGLYVSYYANTASGPSIVLTGTAECLVAALATAGTATAVPGGRAARTPSPLSVR